MARPPLIREHAAAPLPMVEPEEANEQSQAAASETQEPITIMNETESEPTQEGTEVMRPAPRKQPSRKRQRRHTGPRSHMYRVRRKRALAVDGEDNDGNGHDFAAFMQRLRKRQRREEEPQVSLMPRISEEPGGGPDADEELDIEEQHMVYGNPETFSPNSKLKVDVKVKVVKDNGQDVTLDDIAILFHREVSGMRDPELQKQNGSRSGKNEPYEVKLARRAKREYVVAHLSKLKSELLPCGASFPIPVPPPTAEALWEDRGLRVEVNDRITPMPGDLCLHQVDWELQLAKRDRERACMDLAAFKDKEGLEKGKEALRQAMYRHAILAYEKRQRSIDFFSRQRKRTRERAIRRRDAAMARHKARFRAEREKRRKRNQRGWFIPSIVRFLGSSNRRGVRGYFYTSDLPK